MTKEQNGVPPPNHTQTPNVFYDEMLPEITTLSELKVTLAIIRKTFGWHREEDELSLTQLQKLTGLTRQSVVNGITAGLKRGSIKRRKEGEAYLYSMVVYDLDQPGQNQSNQSKDLTSDGLKNRPKLVQSLDTQKKRKKLKEITPYGVSAGYKPAPPPKPKRSPAQQTNDAYWDAVVEGSSIDAGQDGNKKFVGRAVKQLKSTGQDPGEVRRMLHALRELCQLDTTIGDNLMRAVAAVKKLLTASPPYSSRDIAGPFMNWWRVKDWRGKKGQPPTPEQMVAEIGHIRMQGDRHSTLGGIHNERCSVKQPELTEAQRAAFRHELAKKAAIKRQRLEEAAGGASGDVSRLAREQP